MHTYNPLTKLWTKAGVQIAIEEKPFAEGAFRRAHKAQMMYEGAMRMFVCKFAKDPNTSRQLYFNDVEAQKCAEMWAAQFNECRPPKPIYFVPCFVLELVDRPGRPLCGCELYIEGEFKKHNNNVGAVSHAGPVPDEKTQLDIDTAQAFSHFTYERSGRQILICDIQGVAGTYTDPQIHTVTGKGFGTGNLGMTGIRAFLLRHQCNAICTQCCKLPPINSKTLSESPGASAKFSGYDAAAAAAVLPAPPLHPLSDPAFYRAPPAAAASDPLSPRLALTPRRKALALEQHQQQQHKRAPSAAASASTSPLATMTSISPRRLAVSAAPEREQQRRQTLGSGSTPVSPVGGAAAAAVAGRTNAFRASGVAATAAVVPASSGGGASNLNSRPSFSAAAASFGGTNSSVTNGIGNRSSRQNSASSSSRSSSSSIATNGAGKPAGADSDSGPGRPEPKRKSIVLDSADEDLIESILAGN